MNTTKKVTTAELIEVLTRSNKATFVNVTYVTNENKSRTKKGKKLLQKSVTTNGTLNFDYTKKINRILEKENKEVDFHALGNWHEYLFDNNRAVLTDTKTKTKFYVRLAIENHTKPTTSYFSNGKPISKEQAIKNDMFAPNYFAPKKTSGRGSIDKEHDFSFIALELKNVAVITMNKVDYIHTDFIDVRYV